MVYWWILVLHLIGASATAFVGAYALVVLWNHFEDTYRRIAIILGALAAFEILSGTLLSALSLTVSAVSVCERLALYLSLVTIIEALLFVRMKKLLLAFPLTVVLSPIAASLMALLSAVVYGF